MVPRDHGFGTSFKGVGEYLLHDKDHANTNERVAWSHVHNMGTQDAETAFRVMAAVALNQTRLKEQAHNKAQAELPEDERREFRNSGRKSDAHVWHYSLSWSPEEAESLTKEQMIEAAQSSLAVLGKDEGKNNKRRQFADEHQAIFIAHDDGDHPHVHVVVNRVHPEHGNMLSKYNDWQRFSRWAQDYEEARGQVYCQQRVANNMLRDQFAAKGEQMKVYGQGNLPHHLSNAASTERIAANDNVSLVEKVEQREREKAAALAKKGREQAAAQRQARKDLAVRYQERKTALLRELERTKKTERAKVYAQFQEQQTMIIERQQTAMLEFEIREHDLAGKARNIWETVKSQWQTRHTEDRTLKLSDYYKPVTGEAARMEAFKEAQYAQQRQFEIEREKALQLAVSPALQSAELQRQEARENYAREQTKLQGEIAAQDAALKAEWQQRNQEREKALAAAQALSERVQRPTPAQHAPEFNKAAQGAVQEPEQGTEGDSRALEREQRAEMARRLIEQHRQAREDRSQDQAEDKDVSEGDDGMGY